MIFPTFLTENLFVLFSLNTGITLYFISESVLPLLVIFTFSGEFNTFVWEQSCAQPGVRRHEGCRILGRISHYL